MRLEGEIAVHASTSKSAALFSKGFISLGQKKANPQHNAEQKPQYQILLATAKDKKGTVITVSKENVEKVYSNFVVDGRLSIKFNFPDVTVLIRKCSSSSLGAFLKTVGCIISDKPVSLVNRVQPSSRGSDFQPRKTKMTVTSTENYPHIDGFPSSLECLKVSLNLKRVDGRWFSVKNLRSLDLSGNRLGIAGCAMKLQSISRLPFLQQLNLSDNGYRCFPLALWRALPTSLSELDLSKNAIQKIPGPLLPKLKNMFKLNLSSNLLKDVPEEIGQLFKLRHLNLAQNLLTSLPVSLKLVGGLDCIDVTDNSCGLYISATNALENARLCRSPDSLPTLTQLAAFAVKKHSLLTDMLPWCIVRYDLAEVKRCCCCNQFVNPSIGLFGGHGSLNLSKLARTVITKNGLGARVFAHGSFCGRAKCIASTFR